MDSPEPLGCRQYIDIGSRPKAISFNTNLKQGQQHRKRLSNENEETASTDSQWRPINDTSIAPNKQ